MLKTLNLIIWTLTCLSNCTNNGVENNKLYKSNLPNINVEITKPNTSNLISKFCFPTCPTGTLKTNIEITHQEFILSYNPSTKYADWVAYKINKANLSGPNKSRNWKKDPKLALDIALIPDDFKNAYATCNYDKGHQAPLADFSNNKHWAELNYLSNITPQKSGLNRGPWYRLESRIRKLAKTTNGDVYVLAGTYYNKEQMCKLPNARLSNRVPNGYWKVVTLVNKENIYSSAFVFSQNTTSKANYCNYKSSFQNITNLTNLKFNIPSNLSNSSDLLKQLGCD